MFLIILKTPNVNAAIRHCMLACTSFLISEELTVVYFPVWFGQYTGPSTVTVIPIPRILGAARLGLGAFAVLGIAVPIAVVNNFLHSELSETMSLPVLELAAVFAVMEIDNRKIPLFQMGLVILRPFWLNHFPLSGP